MLVATYPTKRDLKAAIGQPLRYQETSMFGAEFKAPGKFAVVGPGAYERKWYASVEVDGEGRIVAVDGSRKPAPPRTSRPPRPVTERTLRRRREAEMWRKAWEGRLKPDPGYRDPLEKGYKKNPKYSDWWFLARQEWPDRQLVLLQRGEHFPTKVLPANSVEANRLIAQSWTVKDVYSPRGFNRNPGYRFTRADAEAVKEMVDNKWSRFRSQPGARLLYQRAKDEMRAGNYAKARDIWGSMLMGPTGWRSFKREQGENPGYRSGRGDNECIICGKSIPDDYLFCPDEEIKIIKAIDPSNRKEIMRKLGLK